MILSKIINNLQSDNTIYIEKKNDTNFDIKLECATDYSELRLPGEHDKFDINYGMDIDNTNYTEEPQEIFNDECILKQKCDDIFNAGLQCDDGFGQNNDHYISTTIVDDNIKKYNCCVETNSCDAWNLREMGTSETPQCPRPVSSGAISNYTHRFSSSVVNGTVANINTCCVKCDVGKHPIKSDSAWTCEDCPQGSYSESGRPGECFPCTRISNAPISSNPIFSCNKQPDPGI